MTVLLYLGHPAHFHLFKETIKNLQAIDVKPVIVIKSKDVLEKLLIDSQLPYLNISEGNAKGNAYKNFFKRLYKLAAIIRSSKPNLLIGSAAELTVLGKVFRIPSYIFFEDDFEAVKKFAKIAGPLATKLVCPNCCSAWKWNDKKIGYNSYHELAYLHPNHFTPDTNKIKSIFNLNEKNFILRFAQLTAYHDVGKSGIDTNIAQQLIDMLSAKGNVFITSERALEPQFEKYRIQISPLDIHHALYFADMYIGDSQTMTAEAAVLGTPAIRFNDFVGELSYLEELEHKFHLTNGIKTNHPEKLVEKVKELLDTPDLKIIWQSRRMLMLKECIDLSKFMTSLVEKTIFHKTFN
jgi:predicted glycosyltransferase